MEAAPGFINNTKGVLTVKSGATPMDWDIEAENDEAIIENLARAAMDQGYGLSEIRSAKPGLEEIFMKLTYGSTP